MDELHGVQCIQPKARGGNMIRFGIMHIHKQYEGLKGRLWCGKTYAPETWGFDGIFLENAGCERCKKAYQHNARKVMQNG